MRVIYQNRYGDNIVFEKVDDNTVKMSGFKSEWCRWGWKNDPNVYTMVDPSGGPYISVGANLKHYFETKKDMIVESISLDQSGAVFKIK